MGKKILVLNASSGISGDMTVGALLDLGADQKVLQDALDSLHLEGAHVVISRVKKSALDACDFDVVLDAEHENHDHDMAYLHPDRDPSADHADHHESCDHEEDHNHDYHDCHEDDHEHHLHEDYSHDHHDDDHGHYHDDHHGHDHHDEEHTYGEEHDHAHDEEHDHTHGEEHAHDHHHDHDHSHGGHDHSHHHHGRNLSDIEKILRSGNLTEHALALALKIFGVVAQAESKVHGESIEHVHFHEVGAVDSIIDIAAVAVCIDNLGITDVIVTDLCEGHGSVMCQHGLLPIPVPATSRILTDHQIPFTILRNVKGELITPTGAAVLAALEAGDTLPERFRITRMGLGAGKRDYATAGVLRAMLIEPEESRKSDSIMKLETNIDDCTGEALGVVMELLMDAGARDVFYTPVYMKKHRPAYMLSVICTRETMKELEEIIFRNTTTIGIREIACERSVLDRETRRLDTPWGAADVKVCRNGSDRVVYPEADSVKALSASCGIGYSEMYHRVKSYVRQELENS